MPVVSSKKCLNALRHYGATMSSNWFWWPSSGRTCTSRGLSGIGKDHTGQSAWWSILSDQPDGLAEFRRLQFPDLLPSDITGAMIFDPKTNKFHFRRGPVFAYIVLVDEINRTSPKVQASLLECMAEGQVTVDNVSYSLDDLFFVIATQNPMDSIGTYPLPLAQLDRFLFKIRMEHVSRDAELQVLEQWGQPRDRPALPRVFRGDVLRRAVMRKQVAVSEKSMSALSILPGTFGMIRARCRVFQHGPGPAIAARKRWP